MKKKDLVEGIVISSPPNLTVDIGNGKIIEAHLSGKMKMNFIRILIGDKVIVQMMKDTHEHGRIICKV